MQSLLLVVACQHSSCCVLFSARSGVLGLLIQGAPSKIFGGGGGGGGRGGGECITAKLRIA